MNTDDRSIDDLPAQFQDLLRVQSDIPAKTQEFIEFLKTLEDGFNAIATLVTTMADQNETFEQSARLGILGQHAEIGDYRRAIAALEKNERYLLGAIVAMVRELTVESPIPGTTIVAKEPMQRINDARAIGEAVVAGAANTIRNRKSNL